MLIYFLIIFVVANTVFAAGLECPSSSWSKTPTGCYLRSIIYEKPFDKANAYCKALDSRARVPAFRNKDDYLDYLSVVGIYANEQTERTEMLACTDFNYKDNTFLCETGTPNDQGCRVVVDYNKYATEPDLKSGQRLFLIFGNGHNGSLLYQDDIHDKAYSFTCQIPDYSLCGDSDVEVKVKGKCPRGYTQTGSACYKQAPDQMTWSEAQDFCTADNKKASLPIFRSRGDYEEYLRVMTDTGDRSEEWIGCTDEHEEGKFLCYSGYPHATSHETSLEEFTSEDPCFDTMQTKYTTLDYAIARLTEPWNGSLTLGSASQKAWFSCQVSLIFLEICPDDSWTETEYACYKDMDRKETWKTAQRTCKMENNSSALPVFRSQEDFDDYYDHVMENYFDKEERNFAWIGCNDAEQEGTFRCYTRVPSGQNCVNNATFQTHDPCWDIQQEEKELKDFIVADTTNRENNGTLLVVEANRKAWVICQIPRFNLTSSETTEETTVSGGRNRNRRSASEDCKTWDQA